jgi:amino acid transporter
MADTAVGQSSESSTARPTERLSGTPVLGAHHIVFFVVAAAAPLGFAVGSTPWAIGRGGIGTACMFLLVGVLLAIFASGFTAMSRFVPNAGAFFSYISVGLGRPLGLGTACLATYAYALATIGSYGTLGVFASQAMSALTGINTSWQVWAFGGVLIAGILGVLNVDLNLRVLGTMLIAELTVLFVLSISIMAVGGAQGLSLDALQPKSLDLHAIGVVFLIVFAASTGFEATVLFREEVRNPQVTIRRATYIAIALIAVFQAFVCWAVIQAFGDRAVAVANQHPTDMYALASVRYMGPAFARILAVLVVTSWLASLIAFHNVTARYVFMLARDRAIPGVFARRAPRTNSPWVASVAITLLSLASVWGCSVLRLDPYMDLFIIASVPVSLGIPTMEFLTALSILLFFWHDRRGESAFAALISPSISALVLLFVVYLSLENMRFYTNRDGALNWILPATNLIFVFIGVGRALWLRGRDRPRYLKLGHWGDKA